MNSFVQSITKFSINQSGLTKEILEKEYPTAFRYYTWSSYLIALAGLVRLLQGRNKFLIGSINLILQSGLSYLSDVITIGRPSYWHLLDRYFAIYVTVHHFYSINTLSCMIINILLFGKGLQLLNLSQVLYGKHDKEFLASHTKWHIIIFLMSVSMFLNKS
jgi:hypothetical protein